MALKSRIPIPKLYKTKKLEINGQEIEMRGYRFIDEEYVVPLRQAAYDLSTISKKMEDTTGKTIQEVVDSKDENDNKYTLEQVEQVGEVGKEIEALRGRTEALQCKLAQRGLKRYYFKTNKDIENYLKIIHESEGLTGKELEEMVSKEMETFQDEPIGSTEWIDQIQDIDIDIEDAALIANTMISLTSSRQVKGKKGKKQENPTQKKNSKHSEK